MHHCIFLIACRKVTTWCTEQAHPMLSMTALGPRSQSPVGSDLPFPNRSQSRRGDEQVHTYCTAEEALAERCLHHSRNVGKGVNALEFTSLQKHE